MPRSNYSRLQTRSRFVRWHSLQTKSGTNIIKTFFLRNRLTIWWSATKACRPSPNSLSRDITICWRWRMDSHADCGYHRETDRMFLSKIYIRKDFRRRGIASAFLKQVTEESQGLAAIYLTVNKHNAGSIAAYQRFGFETIDSVVTDIGHGYVMDDFIMQKSL